jgi:SAM-dependent methyltransferase
MNNFFKWLNNNKLLRKLYRSNLGRFVVDFPAEMHYVLFNKNPYIPPPHLVYTGRGGYLEVGNTFFNYFRQFGTVTPDSKILDIGCGIGRMALPFIGYLSSRGEYWGFDVVRDGPAWCQRKISSRNPNFHFTFIDIYNELYNKKGAIRAEEFKFPYDDEKFDFVFLTSVFTHMGPEHVERYLKEIARVLVKGGRALLTANLLNKDSKEHVRNGKSTMRYMMTDASVHGYLDQNCPHDDIALDEDWLRKTIVNCKLRVIEPIQYGSWCGRAHYVDWQDMIIVEK